MISPSESNTKDQSSLVTLLLKDHDFSQQDCPHLLSLSIQLGKREKEE